jgi:hypothetical protein
MRAPAAARLGNLFPNLPETLIDKTKKRAGLLPHNAQLKANYDANFASP